MIFEKSGKFILKNFGIPLKQKHIIIKTTVNAIMDKIYNIPKSAISLLVTYTCIIFGNFNNTTWM